MSDRASPTQPARSGVVVVLDADIPSCRGLYVGVGGDVEVNFRNNGSAIVLVGVPTGSLLPIDVSKVLAANTTATDMVVLY